MFEIIISVLAMGAVFALLSDKKVSAGCMLKFFGAVFAASALLVFINTLIEFRLTGLYGLAAVVLIVFTIKYARGINFRVYTLWRKLVKYNYKTKTLFRKIKVSLKKEKECDAVKEKLAQTHFFTS